MGPWASMNENLILHSQHSRKSGVVTSASNPKEEEGRLKHTPEAHWPDSQLIGELMKGRGAEGAAQSQDPEFRSQQLRQAGSSQLCLTPAIRNQCPFLASRGTHTSHEHTHIQTHTHTSHKHTHTHHMTTQTHTNTHSHIT